MLLFALLLGPLWAAETVSLNGEWRLRLAATPAEADQLARFHEPGFDASAFRPIPVPANWTLHGFEAPLYGTPKEAGEGFYLHRFAAPAAAGQRVLLHFGGVWASAEVWLNGRNLGRHDSGFTGFAFDVTKALKPENTLAVRVRQITKDSSYDSNDDWALGGIYRDVWLEFMPADRYIDRLETATKFDDQYRDAVLSIRVLVPQGRDVSSDYELRAILSGPGGKEIQRTQLAIPSHGRTGRDTLLDMHVAKPLHWTAETPNLYTLRVELASGGKVRHSRTHRVGFREVATAGGILRVNGRPVKLRGVDRHDENPDVGRATRREHWLEDIRLMKAANINFVRTSHYPPAEGFIELCDELGMYVLDEIPMGFGGGDADDPSMAGGALLRAHETVSRDRNHPSVIIWSIGNEDPLTAIHLAVIRAVKGADPTRPVLMPWRADEHLPPEIDILAPHYRSAADYDRMAAHSARPVLTTEYTHALGEQGFGGLEDRWRALTRHAAGAGGAIWMWQDQGLLINGKLLQDQRGSDGIVNADRTPQRDYWETKAVYAPVWVPAQIAVQPGQARVSVPVRNDYDFLNLETVLIRWKVMADGRQLAAGEGRVAAEPHTEGALELPLGEAAGYAHLAFLRTDGSEIVTRAVEFAAANPPVASAPAAPLRVTKGKTVRVAGWEFDPATGQPVNLRLTIWRPLHDIELGLYERSRGKRPAFPDLDRYATKVRKWNVTEDPHGVRIEAEADHSVDDRNAFTASYEYRIGPDGELAVRYTVRPRIEPAWLPEIGFELAAPGLDQFRWLGLGPLDGYPNEKAAPIFGLWTDPAGTKAGVRWAEVSGKTGGFRVTGGPYVRFENGRLRVLSAVAGRPDKTRRADEEYRLDVKPGKEFSGGFTIARLRPGALFFRR